RAAVDTDLHRTARTVVREHVVVIGLVGAYQHRSRAAVASGEYPFQRIGTGHGHHARDRIKGSGGRSVLHHRNHRGGALCAVDGSWWARIRLCARTQVRYGGLADGGGGGFPTTARPLSL